jgi:hypothetical protein
VAPLLVLLAINLALLPLGVLPLRRAVAAAEADAAEAAIELDAAARAERAARQAHGRREEANAGVAAFYREVLPPDLRQSTRLLQVSLYQIAREHGVEYYSSDSDYAALRESRLVRVSSQTTLRGAYPDIRRFLHAVETSPEFVIIERVQLAESGAALGAEADLELLLDVATYFVPASGS